MILRIERIELNQRTYKYKISYGLEKRGELIITNVSRACNNVDIRGNICGLGLTLGVNKLYSVNEAADGVVNRLMSTASSDLWTGAIYSCIDRSSEDYSGIKFFELQTMTTSLRAFDIHIVRLGAVLCIYKGKTLICQVRRERGKVENSVYNVYALDGADASQIMALVAMWDLYKYPLGSCNHNLIMSITNPNVVRHFYNPRFIGMITDLENP